MIRRISCRPLLPVLLVLAGSIPVHVAEGQEKTIDRLRRDLKFLASDECEGRGVHTKGINLAADYIAQEFSKAGLRPGLGETGFFQPFDYTEGVRPRGESHLVLVGPQGQEIVLRSGKDFQVLGLSAPGKVAGDLVFAGYGITAKDAGYDDFAGLNVEGKVVVVLRRVPRWDSELMPFDGKNKDSHAALVPKFGNVEIRKAAAVILVNDFSELKKGSETLLKFTELGSEGVRTIPVFQMRRDVLDELLRTSLNTSLRNVEKAIDADLKPRSSALPGWKAKAEAGVERITVKIKNVIGVLEGSGPLAKETIIIGGHYDHLGRGERGSLAKGDKSIHHGADDNASGTAAVMELARRFAQMKDRQGRRLVFMAFSGEEKGLLGSKHYCEHPIFPLDSTTTMVNLDMVGRLKKDKEGKELIYLEGSGTGKPFVKLLNETKPADVELKLAKEIVPNSDHLPFFNKKIPVMFFFTGLHPEYHRPTDTAERINYDGMVKIVDHAEKIVQHLSNEKDRPEFVLVPVVRPGVGKAGGPKLGIMPGKYDDDKKGLLVGQVMEGGAAQKAGVKDGDFIVEIAGRPVFNINTYMELMRQQKVGQPLDITVLRGEKKLSLKVVPQ